MKPASARFVCEACASSGEVQPQSVAVARRVRGGDIEIKWTERPPAWLEHPQRAGTPWRSKQPRTFVFPIAAPPSDGELVDRADIGVMPCGHGPFAVAGDVARSAVEASEQRGGRQEIVMITG